MSQQLHGLVWNCSLRQVVAASELAKMQNGSPDSSSGRQSNGLQRNMLALALVAAITISVPVSAFAGDTGCGGMLRNSSGPGAITCGACAAAIGNADGLVETRENPIASRIGASAFGVRESRTRSTREYIPVPVQKRART